MIYPPTIHPLRNKCNNGTYNRRIKVGQVVFAELPKVSITIDKPVESVCDGHSSLGSLQYELKVYLSARQYPTRDIKGADSATHRDFLATSSHYGNQNNSYLEAHRSVKILRPRGAGFP